MKAAGFIGTVLGVIIGVLLCGAILTAIPLVFYSLIGKPMTKAQTWSVFIVACVLATIAVLVASFAAP